MSDPPQRQKEQARAARRRPSHMPGETEISAAPAAQATAAPLPARAARADPSRLRPAQILGFQRTVGNRAVSGLLHGPAAAHDHASPPPFQVAHLMRGHSPPYLQLARHAGPAYFRQALRRFGQAQPRAELAGYRARLTEPTAGLAIRRGPLQQIRRMAREPDRAVEDLRQLDNYLGRADSVIGAGLAATDAFGQPRTAERLGAARRALGRVRAPVARTAAVLEMAENLNEVADAIQELEGMDIRRNRRAAAAAFDRLFTNIGEIGESVPGLPDYVVPYFTLLSNVGSFFSDMVDLFDPTTRPGWGSRELRELESTPGGYYGGI